MERNRYFEFYKEGFVFTKMTEDFVSFRFYDLPKPLHFTVAFNSSSSDINLHLSKYSKGGNKLKIEIFRFKKPVTQKEKKELFKLLTRKFLKPFSLEAIQRFGVKPVMFSGKKFESHPHYGSLQQDFDVNLLPNMGNLEKEGKSFELTKGFNEFLELFQASENTAKSYEAIEACLFDLDDLPDLKYDHGFIGDEAELFLPYFKFGDRFFTYRYDHVDLSRLFKIMLGENLGDSILRKIDEAIEVLQKSSYQEEVKPYNDPFYLGVVFEPGE